MSAIGRPSCFTEAKAEKIVEAIRRGLPYKLAAAAGGVSFNTFVRWRNDGSSESAPDHLREFLNQVREAEAEAAARGIEVIEKAAKNDWKAASWLLEKRFPDLFGKDAKPAPPPFGTLEPAIHDLD